MLPLHGSVCGGGGRRVHVFRKHDKANNYIMLTEHGKVQKENNVIVLLKVETTKSLIECVSL